MSSDLDAHQPEAKQRASRLFAEGERLLETGRFEEAKELLLECVRLEPASAVFHNKLGVCYARLGMREDARAAFQQALSLDPTYAPAHTNMGSLHLEAGRLDDAMAAYLQALRHDPDYYIAHHNLGVLYRRQGKISEAVSHWKRANRLEKLHMRDQVRRGRAGAPSYATWIWIALAAVVVFLLLS